MKTNVFKVLIGLFLAINLTVLGQNTKPKDFLLVPANASVTISNGNTASLTLGIPRAGFYRKDVVSLKANYEIQGLQVTFEPAEATSDQVIVKLTAQGATPGSYGLTLVGKSGIVTRGTSVQVIVQ